MVIDYSRFTEKARLVITKSSELASQLNFGSITPELLMVSLLQESREMTYFVLQQMSVDRNAFCQSVAESVSHLYHSSGNIQTMASTTKRILDKACQLAHRPNAVAPEYIFWAFAVTDNPLKAIMVHYGITERTVSNAVRIYRNGNIENNNEGSHVQNSENTAYLSRYARNMMAEASDGSIEPVIGRDDEIRRILQIMSRKTKNNPILVGEPGTGKTAVVECLAHRIIRGDVPQELKGIRLYALDIASLIAGANVQGEFEKRLKNVINEAQQDPKNVIFIDEIHLLIGAGRSTGAMDAANILKPALARGRIKVIGATTLDEYHNYIEKDKAFARRFQKVVIDEPDENSAIAIMRGIKSRFEHFHRIKILDEAVVASVKLSKRYITERFLPDKAIDLLDEAASKMRIERSSVPEELDSLTRDIRCKEIERESIRQDDNGQDTSQLDIEIANLREKENILNAKWQNERNSFDEIQSMRDSLEELKTNREYAEHTGQYEQAARLQSQITNLKEQINIKSEELDTDSESILKTALDENDIREVIKSWTGIPVDNMDKDEIGKLADIEKFLSSHVIGQEGAVKAVSKVIRRNRIGFGDSGRPIGSFLFMGTTGVGKTELAKTLAQYLFGSNDMLIRIDMSEYQLEHSVARLFGAPPGYVGYEQGGQLTEAVRRKPYTVILLDEIEKAHRKVFETLLQVLDDGRMTDGQGHVIDFKNTIIIMTSNLSEDRLRIQMSPEFINRIDDIITFQALDRNSIERIIRMQLHQLCNKCASKGVVLKVEDSAVKSLVPLSYIPEYGARPVRRAINDYIIDGITDGLLEQRLQRDKVIIVSYDDNHFCFHNEDCQH